VLTPHAGSGQRPFCKRRSLLFPRIYLIVNQLLLGGGRGLNEFFHRGSNPLAMVVVVFVVVVVVVVGVVVVVVVVVAAAAVIL